MKIPGSVKFIGGCCATALVVVVGWRGYGESQLRGYNPPPVKPGTITLLAVDTGDRFKILVQNQVAVLSEAPKNMNQKSSGSDDEGNHKRLPIRELLQSLQGDEEGLGRLVMSLNNITEEEIPRDEVDWTGEDISKAINGDVVLKKKLENDLGLPLDGIPTGDLHLKALLRGIVMRVMVPVKVMIEGQKTTLRPRIKDVFLTKLGAQMEKKIGEKFNPSTEAIIGYYRGFAAPIIDGKDRPENIPDGLRSKMSPDRLASLAENVERILGGASVVMNETFIQGATSNTYEGPNRSELTDLTLKLTHEGKMRLWKYSHNRPGFQLMLIVDGIAIAAPKITSELAQDEVTITQLANRSLAEDAVKRMNALAHNGS